MFLSGKHIIDLGNLLCYCMRKIEKKWRSRESE